MCYTRKMGITARARSTVSFTTGYCCNATMSSCKHGILCIYYLYLLRFSISNIISTNNYRSFGRLGTTSLPLGTYITTDKFHYSRSVDLHIICIIYNIYIYLYYIFNSLRGRRYLHSL